MKSAKLPSLQELISQKKERTITVSFRMKESTWARFIKVAREKETNIGAMISALVDYYAENEMANIDDDEIKRILEEKKKKMLNVERNDKLSEWEEDVLNCVKNIDKNIFTLDDIYKFRDELQEKHPENNFVEAKIRQVLQRLRDKNYIEFIDRGMYKKKEK